VRDLRHFIVRQNHSALPTNYIRKIIIIFSKKLIRFLKRMFEIILEYNPSLDIKNRQGLTPLNLAAKLARAEVHISSNSLYLDNVFF
jgi:hypothetical protein